MKERIKSQRGFIPLFIILIASIIVATTGTGVVLHKQGKLPFTANVSETLKDVKLGKLQSKPDLGAVSIKEEINEKSNTTQEDNAQQELEKAKLEVEKNKQEAEKAKAETERLKRVAEEARIKAEQELQRQVESQRLAEEKRRQEEARVKAEQEKQKQFEAQRLDELRRQEEARELAEEQAKKEQNKRALSEYLNQLVETQKQFYQQLIQEIEIQTAERETLLQRLYDLLAQISPIDQRMTAIEQEINMLTYTVREEVLNRIKNSGSPVTQSQFELLVAAEIEKREAPLQQEWMTLNSQRQPLADEYNRLRGNPILDYQPSQLPQAPSGSDYLFYYDSAGNISYILNPDRTKSYVYYTGDGRVNYILNPDGSKNNFYYSSSGQLDRITGF